MITFHDTKAREEIAKLRDEVKDEVKALREALAGALDRLQELELKKPRSHFSK